MAQGHDQARDPRRNGAESSTHIPGIEPSFSQPIRDNVLESISQIDGQIVIKVFGDDLDSPARPGRAGPVRHGARRARRGARLRRPPGRAAADPGRVDRARAARYGLNVADVQDVIETRARRQGGDPGVGGRAAIRRGGAAAGRASASSDRACANLLVATPDGAYDAALRGGDASGLSAACMNIARENGKRVLAIGVFIRGRDMGSVVTTCRRAWRKTSKLPRGLHHAPGRASSRTRSAPWRACAVIVPIIDPAHLPPAVRRLQVVRERAGDHRQHPVRADRRHPRAVAHRHLPLSVSAAIGFIALFGQAVLNGVVMVSYFNQLRAKGRAARRRRCARARWCACARC